MTSSSFSTMFNHTPLPGFSSQQGLSPLHTWHREGLPDVQIPGQLYLSPNTPDEWYHSINMPFSHFSPRGYSKCSKNFFEGHQRVDNCVSQRWPWGKIKTIHLKSPSFQKRQNTHLYQKQKRKRRSMKKMQSLKLNTFSFMKGVLSSPSWLTGTGPKAPEGAQPRLPAGSGEPPWPRL